MKNDKLVKLVLAALFTALCCVATMAIQIPIPATNGYINLGDGAVLLGAFLLGPMYGALAGGLGSAMADLLLGYAAYAPGTFVIKAAMALSAALLLRVMKKKPVVGSIAGGVVGEIRMVSGYFAYESAILGYGIAAAASIPANTLQGVGGLIVSVVVYQALRTIPVIKRFAA